MIRKPATFIITLFIAVFSVAEATDKNHGDEATPWELDRAHTTINFTVNHFFTPVNGTFDDFSSEIYFDPENLEGSRVNITIPVESVNTRNERRDGHLKTGDFFDAERWSEIRFTSNQIVKTGDNRFVARGELTIRDVTREFELPFSLLGVMDHPLQEGKKVAGITANAELLRNDFGVGTGDWIATAVVGNKVNIQLNLELVTK